MILQEILNAVLTVVSIFLMIGAGLFIAWRKWITPEGAKALPKIIINIAFPGMIVYYFSTDISRDLFLSSWLPLLIGFSVLIVSFYIGKLIAVIFQVPKNRRGVFNALFTLSNSAFIGFPVAEALFGNKGMPFAVFYYFMNTTFFWTAGYFGIRKDADIIAGVKSDFNVADIFKKLFNPPIITIFVMAAIIISGIKLPDNSILNTITTPILTTAKYLSGITTPLSLIYTGCLIFWTGKEGIAYERDITPVLLGRFIITPALCFIACSIAIKLLSGSFPALDMGLMRNVFTVQTGLPVMISTVIVADLYGAETQYATRSFFWTTIISLITIPAYMLLFQYIV